MADDFTIPSRLAIEQRYKRDKSIRVPGSDVSDNSPADIDAKLEAASLSTVYARAVTINAGTSLQTKTTKQLDDELAARGDARLPAAGASGFVIIRAATGGANIQAGDGIVINGKGYNATATATYPDLAAVPVLAVDTGPATDQPAGATGQWTPSILGLSPSATVQQRADGRGLIGGADIESNAEVVVRLAYENANPAVSGNEAEYIDRIEKTPGLAVEKGHAYPGILGTGTLSAVATMRRSAPNISRVPSAVEQAAIAAWVPGKFPKDDSFMMSALVTNPVTLAVAIGWATGASWADAIPWPAWTTSMVCVKAFSTPTATSFLLSNVTIVPVPGLTIAFYNPATATFVPKRILTVTASGGDYAIVCDTTAGATDLTYVPSALQPCCPWSAALSSLVLPLLGSMVTLGPGEQIASFFDPGLRQKRTPAPPLWPSVLTTRLLDPLDQVALVNNQSLLGIYDTASGWNAAPYTTPVGTAGTSSNLSELQFLVAFPG